ncbi:hypothetical protein XPA_004507 [Xanthoria parietina]
MSGPLLRFLPLLALIGHASAQASVNASDISIWPPCAQRCIPLGLAPPVNCGSLTNVECVCTNPAFTLAIADCEQSTCTRPESAQIAQLSSILCAPFGGLGPSVSSAVSSFFDTYTKTLPSTPYVVGTATAPPTASSTAATSLPQCYQTCLDQAAAANICPGGDTTCQCQPAYRGFTATCHIQQCNKDDLQVVFDQSYRVCGPFYTSNPALSASVQSAIATATSFVASSASSSATAAITGGVQGLSGSSNGSATGTGGMPAPSPFMGGAARLGGGNLAVLVSVLAGMVGAVVMIRL